MGSPDELSCPSLLDCWLVDCEGMVSVPIDTFIEYEDTLIYTPLRMHAYQELLSYALDELDSIELAVAILETEGSIWAKRLLLPHYLETGQYTDAAQMLTDLDNYQGHPYDEAENQQYYKLYGAVYTTYTAGKTLQEMTATQRNKVNEVAQTPYGVAYAAQAIQAHNLGKRFHRIPDSSPSPQPRISTQPNYLPKVKIYLNPTMGQVTVSATSEIKVLVLYDLFGRIVEQWRPNAEQSVVHLAYSTGMYLLAVELEEGYTEKHRLIIAR
jgi:hypothetical protein